MDPETNENEWNILYGPDKVVYSLFRISLENLVKNKIHISKEYHIQPSEIDKLPFFEYEIYLEQMNLIAQQLEEDNKKQQEQYGDMSSKYNPNKIMQSASSGFKMPSMGSSGSMPNIQMPKVSIPKI